MKLYVGNLSRSTTDDALKELFEQFGEVAAVRILFDRETRQSRGFGFVTMAEEANAKEAMEKLNETEFEGRRLRIDEAREPDRSRTGGNGNAGGGGGFNRNRY